MDTTGPPPQAQVGIAVGDPMRVALRRCVIGVLSCAAAFLVFTALLVLAVAVTAWHLAVKGTGVRGASARQGAMYGWAWFLSFGVVFALGVALDRAGATGEVMSLAMTVASLLMVGALYMACGAIW